MVNQIRARKQNKKKWYTLLHVFVNFKEDGMTGHGMFMSVIAFCPSLIPNETVGVKFLVRFAWL